MADIGQNRQWIVDPNIDVKKKWLECQIQEKISQIVRLEQDIEDLKKGQIVKLESMIIMLNKEKQKLEEDYKQLDKTIDIQ